MFPSSDEGDMPWARTRASTSKFRSSTQHEGYLCLHVYGSGPETCARGTPDVSTTTGDKSSVVVKFKTSSLVTLLVDRVTAREVYLRSDSKPLYWTPQSDGVEVPGLTTQTTRNVKSSGSQYWVSWNQVSSVRSRRRSGALCEEAWSRRGLDPEKVTTTGLSRRKKLVEKNRWFSVSVYGLLRVSRKKSTVTLDGTGDPLYRGGRCTGF